MEFAELLTGVSIVSVVLFVIGISLIIAEMFTPGFGITGTLGVIVLAIDIFITAKTVRQGIILTVILFILVSIIFVIFMVMASKGRLPAKMILQESTGAEAGFSSAEDFSYLLGKTGTVITVCRPAGNADFDGKKLDVVTRGEYIAKGTKVEVIEVEGNRIVVVEHKK